MGPRRLVFRGHAIERMFQRAVSLEDVRQVLATGEVIEEYPHDTPYPSRLLLGFVQDAPIHVVVTQEPGLRTCGLITAYHPDTALWEADFKTRRRS